MVVIVIFAILVVVDTFAVVVVVLLLLRVLFVGAVVCCCCCGLVGTDLLLTECRSSVNRQLCCLWRGRSGGNLGGSSGRRWGEVHLGLTHIGDVAESLQSVVV